MGKKLYRKLNNFHAIELIGWNESCWLTLWNQEITRVNRHSMSHDAVKLSEKKYAHGLYEYLRKKNNWLRLIQSSSTACVSLGFGINFTHALSCYYKQRFASFVQNRLNIAHERNSLIYDSQAKAKRPPFYLITSVVAN